MLKHIITQGFRTGLGVASVFDDVVITFRKLLRL